MLADWKWFQDGGWFREGLGFRVVDKRICAAPWKERRFSAAYSPRISAGFSPCGRICVYHEFFRGLFGRAAQAPDKRALAPEVFAHVQPPRLWSSSVSLSSLHIHAASSRRNYHGRQAAFRGQFLKRRQVPALQ